MSRMPRISNATPRASRNTRNGPSPLQTRLSSLLREARWILFAALAAWLTLVLATWNAADPGWSHSVPAGAVHNRGGMLGAYLADILLYLFGFSAWWWVVLLLHRVRAGYRRLASQLKVTNSKQPEVLPRVHWEEGIGFFLLMVGSLGMEALRLPSRGMHLPGASEHASGAGGVIGHTLADLIGRSIGFTGSTLAFLVMLAIGLSLFFSFSWLNIAERVGAWIEGMVFRVRSSMPRARTARSAKWPRPCAPSRWWPSRKSWSTSSLCASSPPSPWCLSPSAWKGKAAVAVLRPAAGRRGRPARHQPARPAAAQPGNRVGRDHRIHLAPDRKKLADFGVSVTVVAAQAGPVITRYEIEPATGVRVARSSTWPRTWRARSAWSAYGWWKPYPART